MPKKPKEIEKIIMKDGWIREVIMITTYKVFIFKEETAYTAIFPELNYLSTSGDNMDQCMQHAVDCLAGYLYGLEIDGEKYPEHRDIDIAQIKAELYGEQEIACTETNLSVDVAEYAKTHFCKSVKKTLTIPAWLNKKAMEQGINFSQVLQQALLQKIKK